ncbi:MAG: SDR family NAD(P)-dependent oxidoreductase, partial [Gammaproteobacteria bacterium]|nr:SDR family NAD(P)-dependent oxidoreductase [Gammaproteobacteria bacterium]
MRRVDKYEAPDKLLDDRVILISGVTEGIGRALAAECAALGATIVLLGRKVPRLESLHDEII